MGGLDWKVKNPIQLIRGISRIKIMAMENTSSRCFEKKRLFVVVVRTRRVIRPKNIQGGVSFR